MVYAEAVKHLYGLGPELAGAADGGGDASRPVRKFDLAHMRELCAALGDPQTKVPSVLIAGTNGKGSTAATLASVLTAAGYRTGLYTSPHLVRVNERIQMADSAGPSGTGLAATPRNGRRLSLTMIGDEDFARLYSRVDDVCEDLLQRGKVPLPASFFERLTAVAFLYFAERRAEIMILEVGLGGRLDATNVVEPLLSVITDIALDHQQYLGDTIAKIAAEKCGILRHGGVLVTLPQLPEANTAIGLAATRLEVEAINAAAYLPAAKRNDETGVPATPESAMLPRNRYRISVGEGAQRQTIEVDSPLAGVHQQRNIALAVAAALRLCNSGSSNLGVIRNKYGYDIEIAAIEAGIRATKWPGRLEMAAKNVLLDVAHNPAGAWTLRAAIAELPATLPRTLIFSCLKDKSLSEMSRILFPLFDATTGDSARSEDKVIVAPINNARSAAIEDLAAAATALEIDAYVAPSVDIAWRRARAATPARGIIVATGSVYLVGEIQRLLFEEPL